MASGWSSCLASTNKSEMAGYQVKIRKPRNIRIPPMVLARPNRNTLAMHSAVYVFLTSLHGVQVVGFSVGRYIMHDSGAWDDVINAITMMVVQT